MPKLNLIERNQQNLLPLTVRYEGDDIILTMPQSKQKLTAHTTEKVSDHVQNVIEKITERVIPLSVIKETYEYFKNLLSVIEHHSWAHEILCFGGVLNNISNVPPRVLIIQALFKYGINNHIITFIPFFLSDRFKITVLIDGREWQSIDPNSFAFRTIDERGLLEIILENIFNSWNHTWRDQPQSDELQRWFVNVPAPN